MPMMAEKLSRPITGRRTDASMVLDALEDLCSGLGPGGRIPNRAELMRRFDASERSVLRALDDLQRMGRIVRRVGAGTFVADASDTRLALPVISGYEPTKDNTVIAIAEPDQSFFAYGIQQLHRYAEAMNLSLLCRLVDPQTQLRALDSVVSGAPLGFVVLRRTLTPLAERLQDAGHRVVMIGAPHADDIMNIPCIHGDHEHGAYIAANHLIELGHRRIAFALPGQDYQKGWRWLGHSQAIRDAQQAGIEIDASILSSRSFESLATNPAAAVAFFRSANAPTGLVVWNDHEAVRLLSVLSTSGVRVPDDVSVVGYDNLPEGTLASPKLTTIDQALDQQLRVALRLLSRPASPRVPLVMTIPTLIIRASTAPPQDISERQEPNLTTV